MQIRNQVVHEEWVLAHYFFHPGTYLNPVIKLVGVAYLAIVDTC